MDAYRYFFPAGWLLGLWGVVLWILFPWNLVSYPGLRHPEIMSGGFFLFFICGFLMTAAPKFTSTFDPTPKERNVALSLMGALFLSLLSQGRVLFYGVELLLFAFLIFYLARRFLVRKSNPPDSFLFVGFGVGAGLSGVAILFLGEFFNVSPEIYTLGRKLFLQAYVMCLVMGVGSRLVPALLGWAPLPTDKNHKKPQLVLFALLAVLFVVSYFIEVFGSVDGGQFLRATVITFIVFHFWKLHRWPARRGVQSGWMWISAWMLLLGQWGMVFLADLRIHLLHVVLVSGIALLNFMIATRVVLSHGHHNLSWEKSSKGLFLGGLLIVGAGLTRLSAGFSPDIYQSHLLYAACTWTLGLLVWGAWFLPKIYKVSSV